MGNALYTVPAQSQRVNHKETSVVVADRSTAIAVAQVAEDIGMSVDYANDCPPAHEAEYMPLPAPRTRAQTAEPVMARR